MSRISIQQSKYTTNKYIAVNGRIVSSARRIREISKTAPGEWKGVASGQAFRVYGGKAAGAASDEWFVSWPPMSGTRTLWFSSLADAIRTIESC